MIFYKILIVEDDVVLASVLKDFFEENDLEVVHAVSGEQAVEVYEREHPSLVLLDVVLPGISGFEVIRKIREVDNNIPVIMMTGTEKEVDSQVKGFYLGAVNYVQKPVYPQVLLAQIFRLLNPPETEKYKLNGYNIAIQHQELKINDAVYSLKEKDIKVLSMLLQRPGGIVLRSELLLSIWGDDSHHLNNLLDSAIKRIKVIFKNYLALSIKTVYGKGYGIVSRD